MKTRSPALAAHQALGTTTLARCWRFERRDGRVVTVTTCSHDLLILGEIYSAQNGVTPTALAQELGGAVPNSEINGALSEGLADESEILAGLWDGAFVTVFEVNYRDLSMGRMILASGTIGDLKVCRSTFNAEIRGLSQALQQVVGDVYTMTCTATFGDAKCKIDVAPLTVAGALTSASSRRAVTDSTRAEADDYFGAGLITFTSGANLGVSMEINSYSAGLFSLVLPLPFNPAVDDTYEAIPGCRKRFSEDCSTKWDNTVNFRGFPHVPGGDKVLGLGGTEGTQL